MTGPAGETPWKRADGRDPGEHRPVNMTRGTAVSPRVGPGGFGDTRVLCTASVEERVPLHEGRGKGWVTAEYSMLPRSTRPDPGDSVRGGVSGREPRDPEVIGRSLRAGTFLELLGERTVWVDCDVLQADGDQDRRHHRRFRRPRRRPAVALRKRGSSIPSR